MTQWQDDKNRRKQNFEDKANNIDRFHKWRSNINYFESIKICLTNFILKLVIQKNFHSEMRLVRLINLNAYKIILNLRPFMKRGYDWIRRTLNESNLNRKYLSVTLALFYLSSFLLCSISLLIKYDLILKYDARINVLRASSFSLRSSLLFWILLVSYLFLVKWAYSPTPA